MSFNLSEKVFEDAMGHIEIIATDDIKQFIELVREDIRELPILMTERMIDNIIFKYAGEKFK